MKFSFQFDAPKYKCFGGNEPRRSTITAIDQNSAFDRWFLNFTKENSWQQFSKKIQEVKPQLNQSNASHLNQSNLNIFKQFTDDNGNCSQPVKNTSTKQFPIKTQQSHAKSKTLSKKSVSKSHLRQEQNQNKKQNLSIKQNPSIQKKMIQRNPKVEHQVNILNQPEKNQSLQSIKQMPIKRQIPFRRQIVPLKSSNPSQLYHSKQNLRPKDSLQSLDSKVTNQKQHKQKQEKKIINTKQVNKSKSQPNVGSIKNLFEKKRNAPCLYPIRIQRQWEEQHGKKWYELSSEEMNQAQKSMKKKINPKLVINSALHPKSDQNMNQKVTKIKKNHSKQGELMKKSVRNPLYKNPNKNKSLQKLQI